MSASVAAKAYYVHRAAPGLRDNPASAPRVRVANLARRATWTTDRRTGHDEVSGLRDDSVREG